MGNKILESREKCLNWTEYWLHAHQVLYMIRNLYFFFFCQRDLNSFYKVNYFNDILYIDTYYSRNLFQFYISNCRYVYNCTYSVTVCIQKKKKYGEIKKNLLVVYTIYIDRFSTHSDTYQCAYLFWIAIKQIRCELRISIKIHQINIPVTEVIFLSL